MSFVTSRLAWGQVTYGGVVSPAYNFPASFALVSEDVATLLEITKTPGFDYSHVPAGSLNPKTVVIRGTIGGSGGVDSSGAYILSRDDAEAEAQLLVRKMLATYDTNAPTPVHAETPTQLPSSARRFLPLQIGDTDGRFVWGELSKFETNFVEGAGQTLLEVDLEFYCPDPRWLAATPTVVDLGAPSLPPYSHVFTIGGNARTYPRYVFSWNNQVGAKPDVQVGGVIGPDSKIVRLNLPIANYVGPFAPTGVGTATFNCDPRERDVAVMLNERAALSFLGDTTSSPSRVRNDYLDPDMLPFLVPGSNTLLMDGFGNGSGNGSYICWREAWLC